VEPEVSVIVPAHDAEATLPRTLDALSRQQVEVSYEVIVVDDGSRDGTGAIAAGAPGVRVVSQRRAGGAAAARNRGAAEARGRVLAFTDSDCMPQPDWLSAGLACLARGRSLVVGTVRPERGVHMGPFDRSLVVERETGLYETANMLVERSLFDRAGGFEGWIEDRGRPLSEDTWFGWRVRRAGAATAFCSAAVVEHEVFPRRALDYVRERRRLRHFPAMAARVPELRDQLFTTRLFLSPRTATFDLAVAGGVLAVLARSPLPLAAALPYGRHVYRRVRPFRRRAPLVGAVDLVADAVGLASLLAGSVRQRTPVL
jgi:glycosyltransferase involved in cell wall biosynthesis